MSFTQHGVFMDVFNAGVMLSGPSGIGKGSLALSLIDRGHKLIADDTVLLTCSSENHIIGTCPVLLQDFLEVQGLGVLNIRSMFGQQAIQFSQQLSIIIQLTNTWPADPIERFTEQPLTQNILGLDIPIFMLKPTPTCSSVTFIETKVRMLNMFQQGHSAAAELQQRQRSLLGIDGI